MTFKRKEKRERTARSDSYGQLEARNLLATLASCDCEPVESPVMMEEVSAVDLQEPATATLQAASDSTLEAAAFRRRVRFPFFVQPPTTEQLGEVESSFSVDASNSFFDRIDRYEFEVTDDGEFSLDLEFDRRTFSLVAIFDQSRNRVAASVIRGDSQASLTTDLTAGNYVAVVFGGFGRYQLDAEFVPDVQTPDLTPTEPEIAEPEIIEPEVAEPPVDETPASNPGPEQPTAVPDELPAASFFGTSLDWNLNAVNAPEAWQAGYTGEGVVVAVIDTGVNISHTDLDDNIWVNTGEIAGDGIDNDGNGYVDDIHGWNFVGNNANVSDDNGHGTHVAGTIGAERNGFGATGVAPDSTILPIKVLNQQGSGLVNSIARGIRYAVDNGADIVNLSLGGGFSSVIASAISYAASNDVLVVAAAGNEGASTPTNPASLSSRYDNLLSVGAFGSNGRIAGFSNGVGNSGAVQVDAPGVNVYSTAANGGFAFLSGTSMATPHAAGIAALTLSANSNLTASSLRNIIVQSSDRSAAGSDAQGVVNASRAIPLALNSGGGVLAGNVNSTSTAAGESRSPGLVAQSMAAQTLPDFAGADDGFSESRNELAGQRQVQLSAVNAQRGLAGEIAASTDQAFADFEV